MKKEAVTDSYLYGLLRNSYQIISVGGAKLITNGTVTPDHQSVMEDWTVDLQQVQWSVHLGLSSKHQLRIFAAEKFQEVKVAEITRESPKKS